MKYRRSFLTLVACIAFVPCLWFGVLLADSAGFHRNFTCDGGYTISDSYPNQTGFADNSVALNITEVLKHIQLFSLFTMLTLLSMIGYMIVALPARLFRNYIDRIQTRRFIEEIGSSDHSAGFETALSISDLYQRSSTASVVHYVLNEIRREESSSESEPPRIELTDRFIQQKSSEILGSMKYSLTGFKLIGVTAPLLGACCTIYGLIDCFQAAKNAEFVSLWAIAGGVSESLFTFAFGLTVAIPAAALFIYLKSHAARRRVTLRREARSLVSEILGRIPTRALLFESSSVTRTMETEAPPSQTRWLAWTERDDMPTSLWQQD